MKRVFVWCVTMLVAGAASAGAADMGINGTTIIRFEERSNPGTSKEHLVPATQYLGIDAADLADGNLSIHLYGWGRQDFADISAGDKKSEGELSYGYLRYRFKKADAEIKAGRFFISEGVARDQLDGVFTRADLAYNLTASLYGGAPVRLDNTNKGNSLLGGRLAYRRPGWLEIGGSMLHENGAVSYQYSQAGLPQLSTVDRQRQLVGGDLWLAVGSSELTGETSYNTSTSSIAEHNYLLQVRPTTQITVAGFFIERPFKGYFAGTNLPRLFRPDLLDNSSQYGGSVKYQIADPVELIADYRHIRRDSIGGTDRFGVDARVRIDAISSRSGVGYHRYEAPKVPAPAALPPSYNLSFHEIRAWMMYEHDKYIANIDLIAHFYDDRNNPNLNGKGSDYEAVSSIGYRILKNLTLSADVSYARNPISKEEFRALTRAEFAFNFADKGSKK